jgi:hypothetical protein
MSALPPDPPEHVIMSALQWRADRAQREHARPPAEPYPPHQPQAQGNGKEQPQPLDMEPLSVLAARPVPKRSFMDSASLLPLGNVTLLGGDGGMGKSLLAMQLHIACNTGTQWLGLDIEQGSSLYMSAEDDRDEVHRRAAEICAAEGIDLASAYRANMIYRAGQDAVMAIEKNGLLVPTPFFHQMEASVAAVGPQLLILDNQADVFTGNENNRSLAKHFIGLLRGLCLRHECSVLLLGHPSLSGMASGSGMSGSTAWSNSVRSRLYLHAPDANDSDDKNVRILEVMKANYGPTGQRIELKWLAGRFVRTEHQSPWQRVSTADPDRAKEVFSTAGRWRWNEQSPDWGGYGIADMLGWDVGRGIGSADRSQEQNRNRQHVRTYLAGWVKSGTIHIVNGLGPDRKPTQFYSNKPEEKP